MTPFVEEIWDGWPWPACGGAPSAALFSPTMSLAGEEIRSNGNSKRERERGGGRGEPFLCVYAGGLSPEAEAAVTAAVMRLLRCRLLLLLHLLPPCERDEGRKKERKEGEREGEGRSPQREMEEVLRRCCVVSGSACRVRWHPSLVQVVVRSLEAELSSPQAQHLHNTEGEFSAGEVEGERGVLPSSTSDDGHEVAVPQPTAENGMELWSDDGELSGDDGSPEERIIRASRRQATSRVAARNETSAYTGLLIEGKSDDSLSAFAPFIVRGMDLSQTCLPLRWAWRHRLPKFPKEKYVALQVVVDSLAIVRQSRRDERVAMRLINRLYDKFLLAAERYRESGNSSFEELDAATASVDDYMIVLHAYEQCVQLAQRGVALPYETHWLSQGFLPFTTSGCADDTHAAAQESRKRIYSVLESLSEGISGDASQGAVAVPAEGSPAKHLRCTFKSEAVEGMKNISAAAQRQRICSLMGIPGDNYFNDVLLSIRLDCASELSSRYSELNERVNADPIVAPARAAMGSVHTTPLHLVLYMLRRQIVAGTANAALIALRIYALHHDSRPKPFCGLNTCALQEQSTFQAPSRWSIKQLERYARPCDGAGALALEILRWHTLRVDAVIDDNPALPSSRGKQAKIPADVQEVLWCVCMYVKLRLRGSRLWGCVGNQNKKEVWMKDLKETLERWDRQRRRNLALQTPSVGEGIEHFFAKIPEASWQALLEDARASISME